jgi:hypothetical protein
MPRTTARPPIYLFAAEAEFAQGHFPKSHAQNVPVRKSLRYMANAQKYPCGDTEMRACPWGTGTRVRIFLQCPCPMWYGRRAEQLAACRETSIRLLAAHALRCALFWLERRRFRELRIGPHSSPKDARRVQRDPSPIIHMLFESISTAIFADFQK